MVKQRKSRQRKASTNDENARETMLKESEDQSSETELMDDGENDGIQDEDETLHGESHFEDRDVEMEPEYTEADVEPIPEEKEISYPSKFDVRDFRRKLRQDNFITELRHFLYLHNSGKRDIVAKFIEKKGTPLELVEAFARLKSQSNYDHFYLADAFCIVLERIVSDHPNQHEPAAGACRHFAKYYISLLQNLLQSTHPDHRKTGIRLVGLMSTITSDMIRPLLNCFDVLNSPQLMARCFSNKGKENEVTVRQVYLQFILSLLENGTTFVIRVLLDKYELIASCLGGLEFDDYEAVISILTAFKKRVVESLLISKTKKVRVFDSHNTASLLRLYEWKGPAYLIASRNSKERFLDKFIDKGQQELVRECASDFLIQLLSSRKYGIAFDAMTHYKQRKNEIQKKTLASIHMPWRDPLKRQLVIQTLLACPELAEGMMRHLSSKIRTGSRENIVEKLDFVAEIVNELNPKVMRSGLSQITLTHFTKWIKELCLPERVLSIVKNQKYLKSPEHTVRVMSIRILSVLFRQYCNYMVAIIEREKFKGNELRKFRFDMLDHLFQNFPTVENILLGLFMTVQSTTQEGLIDHMDHAFDLLLNICKANRSFVDKTLTVVNYIKLIYPLFESEDDDRQLRVKLKGMKLLLLLDPTSLLPSNDAYYNIVENLCLIFCNDRSDKFQVGPILEKLLLNSNIFDNGTFEIGVWLETMKFVDKRSIPEIVKCWTLIKTADEVDMSPYFNIDYTSRTNLEQLFHDIESGNTVQGYMENPVMSKVLVLMLQNIGNFSNCSQYFELVALFLFHFIPAPKAVQEIYSSHFSTYYKYMLSWVDKGKIGKLKAETMPGFNEMYLAIVEGRSEFGETFKGSESITVNGVELSLAAILHQPRYIMILIYQICFVVSQLADKKHLEEIQANAASHYLINLLHILNSYNAEEKDDIVAFDISSTDERTDSHIEQALKYIYSKHMPLLQNFSIFGEEISDKNFIKFLCTVTETVNNLKIQGFASQTANYRSKIVNQVSAAVSETLQSKRIPPSNLAINAVETLQMSDENCLSLLTNLSQLKAKYFILDTNNRSIYFDFLVFVLNRLAELKKVILNEDIVSKISKIYVRLLTNLKATISLEKLEEAFYNFLKISHQCIEFISKDVFLATFENPRITKSTVKFATLFLERRDDLITEFLTILPKELSKKELVYPLLKCAILSKASFEADVVSSIYKEYKNGIMKAIEKPQKSAVIYKENVETSIYLIEHCMASTDFHKRILKTDSVEVFQLQMIEAIFRKEMHFYAQNANVRSVIFINFLNSFIQHFSVVVKREPLDSRKIFHISYAMYNWIKNYEKKNVSYDFSLITSSQTWQSFCKTCLKYGMRAIDENAQEISGCDEVTNSELLKLLAFLFEKFYESSTDQPTAATLFEMIISHSRFFDIVLSQDQGLVKTHLMHLMLVLTQKNRSVMEEKHIPVLLGAYQAKLSICDRYTLALLQFYEQSGINCSKYRPFIWGELAIDHYSLKSEEDNTILQHDVSLTQLMSIVHRRTSDFTITNFPIWRNLDTLRQLPAVQFENPQIHWKGYGRSELEQKIEAGQQDLDKSFLKLYPVNQRIYDDCYDPAFMIPLLAMSVSPGAYLHPVRPVQNGLLEIAFAALSSLDKEMRLAAGLVHLRYREHFENSKFLDKPLWIQAYQNIQTGLEALQQRWSKHKNVRVPRAPYVSSLFLAVAMTTLIDPLDPMYKVLSMYLRVKETFNFLCVPEFYVLFHSPEVEHLTHRQFILDIIRNGVKCSSDLFLLVTTGTFKTLMGFYNATMSTVDINLRILAVINVCVKIPGSVKLMTNIGIIPWLNSVIDSTEFFHFDTIEAIVSIASNLWYAVKATEKSSFRLMYTELLIFDLTIKLIPLISNRLSLNTFTQYLNVLARTANGKHRRVPEKSLDHLITCVQRHFADHIWYVHNVKQFGNSCVESSESYCKYLKESELDDQQILGMLGLRNFVVQWKALEGKEKS